VSDEIQVPTLPDLKIIKDGKQVDTSAIDNYDNLMSFIMLASIAANTAKNRRYNEDRTSTGRTTNFPLNITPIHDEIVCPYPAQSFYIVNDGPGQIFVALNSVDGEHTPLFIHDEKWVNFETHKLQRFYVWSAPGTVARARAEVKY
jgi:hypothetical protein